MMNDIAVPELSLRTPEKRIISIKAKLLLLLILLPTVAVSLYFFLAVRLFELDKIAYIFDSSAAVSKTLASQTASELQTLSLILKPVLDDYPESNKDFKNVAKQLFSQGKGIMWLSGYTRNENGAMISELEANAPNFVEATSSELIDKLVTSACESGFALKSVVDSDSQNTNLYIAACNLLSKASTPHAIVALLQNQDIFTGFNRNSIYSNYLISKNGQQILGPSKKGLEDFSYWDFFSTIHGKNHPSGTMDTTSPDGRKLLASYSRINFSDYFVLSLIERKSALEASETLFWKSLVFLMAIVAFSLIVSVFASNSLTVTIRDLAKATRVIAEGNFNIQVEVRSNDEIGRLASSFNRMATEVARLIAENAEYARGLEIKVRERTQELTVINLQLNALLNSLGQGFLIFNQNGICSDIYSKACERILEANPSGESIWKILKVQESDLKQYRAWCDAIFNEMIPFEDLVRLAPQTYPHSLQNRIELEYYPIRNSENSIEGIVMVATDKTKEHEANLATEREHKYVETILTLIRAKEQFLSFTNESNSMIEAMRQESKKKSPDFSLLMRYMHTIKGGAAIFGEQSVVDKAHSLETWISSFSDKKTEAPSDFPSVINKELKEVETAHHEFFDSHGEILGRKYGETERRNEVSIHKLESFLEQIKGLSQSEKLQKEFTENFIKEPVSHLLSHYNRAIKSVAQNMNKQVKPLIIEGGDIKILHSRYHELFSSFIHIFRNAVDHGIESYRRRVEQGKDAAAQISIKVSRITKNSKPWILIQIADDGGGIEAKRIRERLASKNNGDPFKQENDEQVIQHIFDAGFSTKEEVTDLSGRGVGLDMVKMSAQKIGGNAKVITKINEGTTFIIEVPEIEVV